MSGKIILRIMKIILRIMKIILRIMKTILRIMKIILLKGKMSFPDFTRHFLLLLSETVDSFFYAILIQ